MKKSLGSINALAIAGLLGFFPCLGKQREPNPQTESSFTPAELTYRMLHRRAVDAVIWGMPAVNYDLMYQAAQRQGTTKALPSQMSRRDAEGK